MLSGCFETFKSDHTGDRVDERAVTEVSVSELAAIDGSRCLYGVVDLGRLMGFMSKGLPDDHTEIRNLAKNS